MSDRLPDVQKQNDGRNQPIQKVGIKEIKYPLLVKDRRKGHQKTVGSVNMYVNLPHHFKGTHMSRFVEILNETHTEEISIETLPHILREVKERLEAEESFIELVFPYFIEKKAPVSGAQSLLDYECRLIAQSNSRQFQLVVQVPLMTVCPCSKTISRYGAHNQRALAIVKVVFEKMVWIEDVIDVVEKSGSSSIYPLLKRQDEKYVTETSHNNPAFVEDVARNIAGGLRLIQEIQSFTIEVESWESIHNHMAYAFIES